jgi:alkanesulfonate monooxygenase SsuD/methylene tetrahydromethanopterin reductase-like flavin-dependent oxidoreductase (luciferase family)
MMRKILFGANIPQMGSDYDSMKRTVLECEKHGFDFVWIADHLQGMSPSKPYFEGWTTLSALAAETRHIRLCTVLMNNLFRHPSLLAKMSATLDVISAGRLNFGIGAGWYSEECVSYGIPFPKSIERIQRLEEAIEIIRELWTGDEVSFAGKYYTLKNAILNPKPIQKPHPPIWTGIMYGRRRMLRVIAKHADAWTISSLYLPTPKEHQQMKEALDDCCRAVGRDPNQIQQALGIGCVIAEDENRVREKVEKFKPMSISVKDYSAKQMRLEGTPQQLIEQLRTYTDVGVTCFVMNFPDITTIEPVRLFSEKVIPAFK